MSNSTPRKADSTVDSSTVHQITCPSCERTFPAHRVPHIDYRGGEVAEYTCPECDDRFTHHPPETYIERPPAIVDHAILTDEDGQTTARVFFEGGAWLQYRETARSWVREELFTPDGREIASVPAGCGCESDASPAEQLLSVVHRYPTYTTTGLRLQRPQLAAILLHDH